MIVQTQNGSIYEFDLTRKHARKLVGRDAFDWRPYEDIYPDMPDSGRALIIEWPGFPAHCSITTKVVRVSR